MINAIIRLIKKCPFLHNLAKRFNRRFRLSVNIPKESTVITYYGFVMNDLCELERIKAEYEKIKKYNTTLFILVNNKYLNLTVHKLIRENPDICFSDFNYFKKYNKRLSMSRIIWIDYSTIQKELLEYLV